MRARQPLPAAVLGMVVAHFGVGLAALGITGVQSFKVEKDVRTGGRRSRRDRAATTSSFAALRDVQGPNFTGIEADVVVSKSGEPVTVLHPQKRLYNSGGNPMTEAGIEVGAARDLFAALGDDLGQGRWSLRLQYKPLIRYIWLGAILIALGGLHRRTRPTLSRARAGASGRTCRSGRAMKLPLRFLVPAIAFAVLVGFFVVRPAARAGQHPVAADRQARAGVLAGVAGRSGMESWLGGFQRPSLAAQRLGDLVRRMPRRARGVARHRP